MGANSLCKREVFGVRGRGGKFAQKTVLQGESGVKLERIF